MSRSIDRISHDVENLKINFLVPKFEESIKALYVSMIENKRRTATLRAKREFLESLAIAFIKMMKILNDWCFFYLFLV